MLPCGDGFKQASAPVSSKKHKQQEDRVKRDDSLGTSPNIPSAACRTALLQLLQSALWGRAPQEQAFQGLTRADWQSIFLTAQAQTVMALAFQAFEFLSDELLPDDALLTRWMVQAEQAGQNSRHMNEALTSLCEFFTTRGLQPVVLKGQSIARLYRHPLARECGDIDLHFPIHGQAAQALRALRDAGVHPQAKPDGSYLYSWQDVPVEHHPRLTDLASPFARRRLSGMLSRFPSQSVALGMGTHAQIMVPEPTVSLFIQSTHILKHAMGWGIGLRQMADLAVSLSCQTSQIDGRAYQRACSQAHLLQWNGLLHGFLTQCLGLPLQRLPYADRLFDSQPLQERVWRDGNFGLLHTTRIASQSSWRSKCRTAVSMLRHARFGWTYAPAETLFTALQLMAGQFFTGALHTDDHNE